MAPVRLWTLACLLMLLSPVVLGQDDGIDATVSVLAGGEPADVIEAGQLLALGAVVTTPVETNTSWRAFLNATVHSLPIESAQQLSTTGGTFNLTRAFNVPANATGEVLVVYTLTVESLTQAAVVADNSSGNATAEGNATSETNQTAPPMWQARQVFTDSITLMIAAPPQPPAGPPIGLIAGAAGLILVALAAVVIARRKPKQIQAAPRSKALQEIEAEDKAEKARKKGKETPAETVVVQEPKLHPQVKILEARAADVVRLIELAKQRHESGQISEHQFKMIREKKEVELQRIHEEMDELRHGN